MKKWYALLCIFFSLYAQYNSFEQIQSVAAQLQEYPDSDSEDWETPDFSSLYEQQQSPLQDILSYFGFHAQSCGIAQLDSLLQAVNEARRQLAKQGAFVEKIDPAPQEQIIIFGDLHGAFHSFVRDLGKLIELDILHDDLTLSTGSYVVFNGNTINDSPYNAQMMLVILSLMQKNPERVIYVKGSNEENLESTQLYKQIKTRLGTKVHSVFIQLKDFFNSLPKALYVTHEDQQILEVAAGQFAADEHAIPDVQKESNIITLPSKADDTDKLSIGAKIQPSDFSRSYGLNRYVGLPVTWSVLSGPTGKHRRLYAFFYDAFAVINTAIRFKNWSITLYYQDARAQEGFLASGAYNLSTGSLISGEPLNFFDAYHLKKIEQELASKKQELKQLTEQCKGVVASKEIEDDAQEKVIPIGSSLDLSKSMKEWGRKIRDTFSQVVQDYNKQDHGYNFQTVFLDDGYNPAQAQNNYETLMEDFDINIVLLSLGTPTTEKVLPLVEEGKLGLFFPITESSIFRNPDLKNVINLSRSYHDQGRILIEYILKKNPDIQKVALFYQDDSFGRDALKGALDAFKPYDNVRPIKLPYQRNQKEFADQRSIIEQEEPEAIGFFSVPTAAQELLRGFSAKFLSRRSLFGISDLGEKELQRYLKERGIKIAHTSAYPNAQEDDMPLVKAFRNYAQKYGLTIGPFALEAYASGKLFLRLVNMIEGDFSFEKIIQAAEKLYDYDYEGLKLSFDPETRTLLNSLWLSKGDGSPWEKIVVHEPEKPQEEPSITPEKEEPRVQPEKEAEPVQEDAQPAQAVKENKIVLGNTADYSKGLKAFGKSLKAGIEYEVDRVNKEGGIDNKVLQVVFLDDGYIPEKAVENIQTLREDIKTDIVLLPLGTPTLAAYINLIKEKKLLVLFPFNGVDDFRKPDLEYIINYAPSYATSAIDITKHVLQNFSIKKIAVFYQEGPLGDDSARELQTFLKEKVAPEDMLFVSHAANDMNFTTQIKQIKDFDPDALGFVATPNSAQGFIRQAGVDALSDKHLFGLSALGEQSLQQFVQEKGLSFMYPSFLPNIYKDDIPLIKEYKAAVKAAGDQINPTSFEGYTYGALTTYLLRQVKGVITKEKIIKAAENIKDHDFKGLPISFNRSTRTLAKRIWINPGDGSDWLEKDITYLPSEEAKVEHEAKKDEAAVQPEKKPESTEVSKSTKEQEEPQEPEVKKEPEQKEEPIKKGPSIAVHGDTIVIGNTSDFNKGLKAMSDALKAGMNLKLSQINE